MREGKMECKTCGAPGDCDGTCDRCANCWEVEKRLADYIKSDNGKRFVALTLNNAGRWRKMHKPGVAILDGCSSSIHTDDGLVKLTLKGPRFTDAPMLRLNMQPETAHDLAASITSYANVAKK
jgi:hypothetical protein